MVKLTWKIQNGSGPYAYLQDTVRDGDQVTSPHRKYLGYLGAWSRYGTGKMIPGEAIVLPNGEHFEITGLTESVRTGMGPTGRARLAIYDAQVRASVPTSAIKSLEDFNLKPRSVELLVEQAPRISLSMPAAERMDIQRRVMTFELGARKGRRAADAVESVFGDWKRSANSRAGKFLRWAAAETEGMGNLMIVAIRNFNDYLMAQGRLEPEDARRSLDDLASDINSRRADELVEALRVTRNANHVVQWLNDSGRDEISVYRGWRPDQLAYMGVQNAAVNDTIMVRDLQTYSWSYDPNVANKYGLDSVVSVRSLPVGDIMLTDRLNNPGVRMEDNDDEVLFKPAQYATNVLRTS